MDDDSDLPRRQYPLSSAKMSKTPSWVMLGFVLGAVTVWSIMPQLRPQKPPSSAKAAPKLSEVTIRPGPPLERQPLTTIEAVFEEWSKYAVWEHDLTEVALWDDRTKGFTDYYEVLRYAGRYYFRPIPALTRRVIDRGPGPQIPNNPLRFTETEEQYQEWRRYGVSQQPRGDYRPLSAFQGETAEATKVLPRPEVKPLPPPKFDTIVPFEPPPVKSAEPGKK